MYRENEEGIERFRGKVSEDVIDIIISSQYREGYEWVLGLIDYAEDEDQVNEISKSIMEQMKQGSDYWGMEEIVTEEEEEEMREESARRAKKFEEEYRKEQEKSRELIKRLLY